MSHAPQPDDETIAAYCRQNSWTLCLNFHKSSYSPMWPLLEFVPSNAQGTWNWLVVLAFVWLGSLWKPQSLGMKDDDCYVFPLRSGLARILLVLMVWLEHACMKHLILKCGDNSNLYEILPILTTILNGPSYFCIKFWWIPLGALNYLGLNITKTVFPSL